MYITTNTSYQEIDERHIDSVVMTPDVKDKNLYHITIRATYGKKCDLNGDGKKNHIRVVDIDKATKESADQIMSEIMMAIRKCGRMVIELPDQDGIQVYGNY